MKKSKFIYVLFVFSILLISSCAKDGETGPAGADGNANVKSYTFTVNPGDWSVNGSPGQAGHAKYYVKSIPQITTDIVENGMVVGYLFSNGYNIAIPFTSYVPGNASVSFFSSYELGGFEVDVQLSNLATPNTSVNYTFRAVVASGVVRTMNPDLDWSDYTEVSKRFHLD